MESLDTTILNTAVPAIALALQVAPLSMKAVLASYTLSLAVFIPISGWMADRFGTRRVFASAIGIFTIGSFLCGISSDIHVLVACRILQGCGGAMMLPVGRLTMVRTFAKSELVRAMSFVAIPGLIGPMLGPVVGGLIVGYFHWSVIFFVNVPIGLARPVPGLSHISRTTAEDRTYPLDIVGLILFGSGIALLSYVLEVFGEHTLSGREMLGLAGALPSLLLAGYGLHTTPHRASAAAAGAVSHPHVPRRGQRQLLHAPGHRRHPLPVSAALPGRARIHADPVRAADDAAGACRDEPEDDHAAHPYALWLPQVLISNTVMLGVLILLFATIGPGHAGLADRGAHVLLRFFHVAAVHQHEHAGLCRRHRGADQQREHHLPARCSRCRSASASRSASLVTALFIPDRFHADAPQMIHGIHQAFLVLGGMTIVSAVVFAGLKRDDGEAVSRHKVVLPAE